MAIESDRYDRERYRNELLQRMEELSADACVAIAARAAWRVVPLMFTGWTSEDRKREWWKADGESITAKLAMAACFGTHHASVDRTAAAVADAAYSTRQQDVGYPAYSAYPTYSAAAHAAAYAHIPTAADAINAAAAYADWHLDDEGASFCLVATDADLLLAHEGGAGLNKRPLWPPSTSRDWLQGWSARVDQAMMGTEGALMLHAWLEQWVRGNPPIDRMRNWFNDWWLKHPRNTERTPAFSDMPARLATEPFPLSDPPTETASEPAPTPTPEPTPGPTPEPQPEPEVIEKEVFINHLESTVAFVSDREAAQLTPTAEKCKEALAQFLASRETQAPLTVSVEAPWGAGKTSFMSHLRKRLEAEIIPTVWFNPWKHEAGKTMWAAFAVAYERQMGSHLSAPGRLVRRIGLTFARLSWGELILLLLRLGLWVLAGWALWWLVEHGLTTVGTAGDKDTPKTLDLLIKGLPWIGGPVLIWRFAQDVASQFGSPLKLDVVRMFTENHHEDGVDDLHKFHEDFARLMRSYHPANSWWVRLQRWWDEVYAGMDTHWQQQWHTLRNLFLGRGDAPMPEPPKRYDLCRVVVFIDDLDRCEAPKAADVLQSLHLMLNVTETCMADEGGEARMPDMICVLGMDREKVAAAVAAKHEKLLPLLLEADKQTGKVPKERAMGFGHEFLEKFIQLTLHLPGMMGEDRLHYLRGITGRRERLVVQAVPAVPRNQPTAPTPAQPTDNPATPTESAVPRATVSDSIQVAAAQEAAAKREVEVRVKNVDRQLHDGETAYDCALYVADALENNPRRLKQFVNLLRLRLLLAAALDLLDVDTLSGDVATVKPSKLSVHHLAKLVALDLTCPQSMATMRENPGTTLDGLTILVAREQVARASVFTTMLGHGGGPCFKLDSAPLSTYFQQLASVTPAVTLPKGEFDVEDFLDAQELAEQRQREALVP